MTSESLSNDSVSQVDVLHPPASLLIKLGSIAKHTEELLSPGGHPVDEVALQSLLHDPEIVAWMRAADALALLPVAR